MELPITMPASGMTYCGRYHGSTCTMTPVTEKVTMKPVSAIDTKALPKIPLGASGLRCTRMRAANSTISRMIPTTSHGELTPKTQRRMKPRASSCT